MTIGLLHTTESDPGSGPAVDAYFRNGRLGSAPHIMLDPASRQTFGPYYDHRVSSKALANKAGGVETNNRPGGVFQVEIVGRAADIGGYDNEWYAWLKDQLAQWSTIAGVDYVFHEDPARFTFDEWMRDTLKGWFRHSNVPENDHWDPGTLDYNRLRLIPPTPPGDPEMEPGTKYSDGTNVNDRALWTGDAVKRIEEVAIPALEAAVAGIHGDMASLKNVVNALATVGQAAGQVPVPQLRIDYDLLAGKVCDELARRIVVAAPKG